MKLFFKVFFFTCLLPLSPIESALGSMRLAPCYLSYKDESVFPVKLNYLVNAVKHLENREIVLAAQELAAGHELTKSAELLEKEGLLLDDSSLLDLASRQYAEVGDVFRQAALEEKRGRLDLAAGALSRAGKEGDAAAVRERLQAEKAAGDEVAAKKFESRGEWQAAAEKWEKLGNESEAVRCYLAAANLPSAIEILKRGLDPHLAKELQKDSADALKVWGEYLLSHGLADVLAKDLLKFEMKRPPTGPGTVKLRYVYGKESWRTEPVARELFIRALEKLRAEGKADVAARLQGADPGAVDFSKNQREVAGQLERLGKNEEAAEAYARAGDRLAAGQNYYRAGKFNQAAEHFAAGEAWARAEVAYRRDGDDAAVARMRLRQGLPDAAAKLAAVGVQYLTADKYQEALWAFREAGDKENALATKNSLEGVLRHHSVVSNRPLGGGIRDTYLVELSGSTKGVFVPDERGEAPLGSRNSREVAVSTLAEMMNSNFTRITVRRKVRIHGEDREGALSYFVEDAKMSVLSPLRESSNSDLALFNWWVRDADRSDLNHLVHRGMVFGIDYEDSLKSNLIRPNLDRLPNAKSSKDFYDRLNGLKEDDIRTALAPLLNPTDIELALERRRQLLEHLRPSP